VSSYGSGGYNPPLSVSRPIAANYSTPTVTGPTPPSLHASALVAQFTDTATTIAKSSLIDNTGMRV